VTAVLDALRLASHHLACSLHQGWVIGSGTELRHLGSARAVAIEIS
jgi:hypothetical protein